MFAHTSVEFNYSEFLAKTFIFPATVDYFIHENNFSNAPIRWFDIATKKILYSLDPILKVFSGINLISQKSKYSEVDSQW